MPLADQTLQTVVASFISVFFAVEKFSTYKSSLNTFFFGLKTNYSDVPVKLDILPSKHHVAIRWTPTLGPVFGTDDLVFVRMYWIRFGSGFAFLDSAVENFGTLITGQAELQPSDVEVLYMDGM